MRKSFITISKRSVFPGIGQGTPVILFAWEHYEKTVRKLMCSQQNVKKIMRIPISCLFACPLVAIRLVSEANRKRREAIPKFLAVFRLCSPRQRRPKLLRYTMAAKTLTPVVEHVSLHAWSLPGMRKLWENYEKPTRKYMVTHAAAHNWFSDPFLSSVANPGKYFSACQRRPWCHTLENLLTANIRTPTV